MVALIRGERGRSGRAQMMTGGSSLKVWPGGHPGRRDSEEHIPRMVSLSPNNGS